MQLAVAEGGKVMCGYTVDPLELPEENKEVREMYEVEVEQVHFLM